MLIDEDKQLRLKQLPAVEKLFNDERVQELCSELHPRLVKRVIRDYLDEVRSEILAGMGAGFQFEELITRLQVARKPSLTRAINGLGVVLHTGLGRAPLAKVAQQALTDVSEHFAALEINLRNGRRGNRYEHVEPLLCELTGAEAAMVVNNNCAATLLILATVARGKEVIVSRGQLIEIGGSFRIPEVMLQSGCRMVEVGTTNRTHFRDYENAITPETGAILRVHTSNYRIIGFTKEVGLEELVRLGRKYSIPVIDDLGSGALIDLSKYGLPKEPVVSESIATGADVVCFSGDKLIGGCQAGIIVGRRELISRMKKNPLTRALRCDKLTYAVLERTLELFLDEERVVKEHSLFQILLKPLSQIEAEAEVLVAQLRDKLGNNAEFKIIATKAEVGGGSLATESLESRAVAIKPKNVTVDELARKMRFFKPPVFGRVEKDEFLLDFRTIRADEIAIVAQALVSALGN
jgi:L-seryl-tRNA(Ser) seleniumtransferase|uniref:L-seryl-tRNA(Sec) selenium transferase n=1 Tax=candidate division WOR-3 bacterium TaxID=2052148 RepID=A0A7V3PTC3_UNCW3